MNANRKPGWIRLGAPAAVSVVLGIIAGIGVSRATAVRPGLSAVLGAAATVVAWALWEAWRSVRNADPNDGPTASVKPTSVIQAAGHVRGRLLGWTGPLGERPPSSTCQQVGTIEPGGEVIGAWVAGPDRPAR
jgi:hypothetical protein